MNRPRSEVLTSSPFSRKPHQRLVAKRSFPAQLNLAQRANLDDEELVCSTTARLAEHEGINFY